MRRHLAILNEPTIYGTVVNVNCLGEFIPANAQKLRSPERDRENFCAAYEPGKSNTGALRINQRSKGLPIFANGK